MVMLLLIKSLSVKASPGIKALCRKAHGNTSIRKKSKVPQNKGFPSGKAYHTGCNPNFETKTFQECNTPAFLQD